MIKRAKSILFWKSKHIFSLLEKTQVLKILKYKHTKQNLSYKNKFQIRKQIEKILQKLI